MKKYKLFLDLTLIMHRLKRVRLDEYNSRFPIVFIDANDPDAACNLCYIEITQKIMKSKLSEKEKIALCVDLLKDMRISKVFNP
jgi:hypothetical protein